MQRLTSFPPFEEGQFRPDRGRHPVWRRLPSNWSRCHHSPPCRPPGSNTPACAPANRLIFHIHLVNVAVAPVFARLEGLDNRVPGRLEVLSRMFVLARVAAAD